MIRFFKTNKNESERVLTNGQGWKRGLKDLLKIGYMFYYNTVVKCFEKFAERNTV